jgi:arabinan endo-1,5-alpha-L-arabinosidase
MNPIQRVLSLKIFLLTIAIFSLTVPALALEGQIGTHDPTAIMLCDGKYYAFGTGGASHVSDDGWVWRTGAATPGGGGMGPDMIRVGDYYYMYVASNVGGQPASRIVMKKTKSLNPESPDYGWEQMGVVNETDGVEFCNGIDPGCFLDPTDGRMWLTFGSYFGNIRLVEMDPKTGLRIDPKKYVNIAINCEASVIIYHEGYYYILAAHGSCCRGSDSGYNIRTGRSKKITGPYVDHEGVDMMQGGGKLVIGSGERYVGAGHFGLFDEGNGIQKFSFHWEADLGRGGGSVLDIRPLLWKDGWPVAGEIMKEGTYKIESVSTGTALELAIEGQAVGRGSGGGGRGGAGMGGGMMGGRGGAGAGGTRGTRGTRGGAQGDAPGAAVPGAGNFAGAVGGEETGSGRGAARGGQGAAGRGGAGMGGGMMGGGRGGSGSPVADQKAEDVMSTWPTGNIDVRLSNYLLQAQQKWAITPAEGKGGCLGSPYYKIAIAGTDRVLAATAEAELVTLPAYTGSDEQLWRIEQYTDGTWRIMPKVTPGYKEPMVLSAIGGSFPTLEKINPNGNKQRWYFKVP